MSLRSWMHGVFSWTRRSGPPPELPNVLYGQIAVKLDHFPRPSAEALDAEWAALRKKLLRAIEIDEAGHGKVNS